MTTRSGSGSPEATPCLKPAVGGSNHDARTGPLKGCTGGLSQGSVHCAARAPAAASSRNAICVFADGTTEKKKSRRRGESYLTGTSLEKKHKPFEFRRRARIQACVVLASSCWNHGGRRGGATAAVGGGGGGLFLAVGGRSAVLAQLLVPRPWRRLAQRVRLAAGGRRRSGLGGGRAASRVRRARPTVPAGGRGVGEARRRSLRNRPRWSARPVCPVAETRLCRVVVCLQRAGGPVTSGHTGRLRHRHERIYGQGRHTQQATRAHTGRRIHGPRAGARGTPANRPTQRANRANRAQSAQHRDGAPRAEAQLGDNTLGGKSRHGQGRDVSQPPHPARARVSRRPQR